MSSPITLENVLQSPHVWRMGDLQRATRPAHRTGFAELDALLPDGGWPAQGLIDVHCDDIGIGEMSLLLKAQRAVGIDRSIAWLNPPALPYAPALLEQGIDPSRVLVVQPDNPQDILWAAEQILRSGTVGVLFFWLRQPAEYSQLRRLHLAAEAGQVPGFLFRSTAFMQQPSPAPLRVSLAAHCGRVQCSVFKARSLMSASQTELSALENLLQPNGPIPAQLLHSSMRPASSSPSSLPVRMGGTPLSPVRGLASHAAPRAALFKRSVSSVPSRRHTQQA